MTAAAGKLIAVESSGIFLPLACDAEMATAYKSSIALLPFIHVSSTSRAYCEPHRSQPSGRMVSSQFRKFLTIRKKASTFSAEGSSLSLSIASMTPSGFSGTCSSTAKSPTNNVS